MTYTVLCKVQQQVAAANPARRSSTLFVPSQIDDRSIGVSMLGGDENKAVALGPLISWR